MEWHRSWTRDPHKVMLKAHHQDLILNLPQNLILKVTAILTLSQTLRQTLRRQNKS